MADRQINVLLIEDNPGDARLIEEMLYEVDGTLFNVENACRLSDGITRIQKGGIDAVLLDLGLPDSSGLDTFEKVHDQAPEVPIVMLTGLDDTKLALEGMSKGAQDYLVKGKVDGDLLARTLRYAIERKAAEARIEHLNSVLKAIRNVNQLIVTETERDSLLRKSCDALVDARGYDAVWLGSLEGGERFATVVGSGFPDDVSRFSKHVTSGDHPPCIRDALAEGGRVLVLDKSQECGDCFFKDACLGKEALIIRVEYADRFFGLLTVLLAPGVAVNEGEKSLLAEVATDIGLALHNSEITEARKRAEEELLESEEKYKTIYDSSRDAIMILTPEEGFLGGNIAAVTMFGCKGEEEFTSKSPADLSPVYQPDGTLSSVGTQQNMAIAMEKGSYFFEWKHKRMDGGEFFATVLLTRVELQGRKILQATVRDITGQKAAEDALLESEKRLRLIAENMPVMLDAFDDKGNIVAWNSECEKVTGFNADEIVGNPKAGKMLYPDPDYKNYIYSMIMEYRSNFRNLEWDITCRDGSVRTILWSNISEKYPITGWYSWAIGIDITGRKVAEDALLESERKYSEFFRTSRDPIFITTKEGRLVESNDALVEVLGYETMDELLKIAVTKHYENPDDRKRFNRTAEQDGFAKEFPANLVKKDGSIINTLITATVLKDRDGNTTGFQGTIRDITDHKAAEDALKESEIQYKHLYSMVRLMCDNLPDLIWTKDLDGKFIFVNKACCDILLNAKDTDDPIGKDDMYFAGRENEAHPENPDYHTFGETCNSSDLIVMETKTPQTFDEFGNLKGEFIYLDVYKAPFWDGEHNLTGTVGCARVVTKERQAEEQIKRSLQEKEVLLREIHHRVKNNLQVVSSLLNMQARNARDKNTIEILSEARDRVKTMSLIHSQLYEGSDLAAINMKEFVNRLLGQLLQSYPVGDTRITRVVRVDDCPFPISVAVPVGLIINELLSNALKHAFDGRDEGTIEVSLTAPEEGMINLTVSDDGVGLPPGFDIDKSKTLGLRLVKILTEDQLQGNLEVTSDGGAIFRIEFETETG